VRGDVYSEASAKGLLGEEDFGACGGVGCIALEAAAAALATPRVPKTNMGGKMKPELC